MTRFVQSRKQASHERILQAASRAIRRNGYAGAGVAEVMREAGLTHGGFYAHFASRETMLAEAADHAGAESLSSLEERVSAAPAADAYRTLLKTYLSRAHVRHPENGCPVAALGSEMPRQSPEVRQVATRRIREMIKLVARHAPDSEGPEGRQKVLATTATMVGALILARAIDDPQFSEEVLDAAFKQLTER